MPRPPRFSSSVEGMPAAVYSPNAGRHDALSVPACPLNVGDTWLEPFEGARMQDLRAAEHPGLNRYAPTQGTPPLLDAIVGKVRETNGLACEREGVLVCAGATAALSVGVGSIVAPGDEVLILAPFWPLIRGIVQSWRATPVEVPFYDRIESAQAAVDAVRARLGERSVALYVSTPSNPTGRVLPEDWLAALAELAERENLWLFSDEVYEDYVYKGDHVSIGRFAPDRTASVFSFSKAYGMAGNRVGYLVAPPALVTQAGKLGTHSFYCAPTAGQAIALRALQGGAGWIEQARAAYEEVGGQAARTLGLPPPDGSTFLFVDAQSVLDERGIDGILADCLADGVAVAPGASCGEAYGDWLRLCYTAAPPAEVRAAVAKLAKRLRRNEG